MISSSVCKCVLVNAPMFCHSTCRAFYSIENVLDESHIHCSLAARKFYVNSIWKLKRKNSSWFCIGRDKFSTTSGTNSKCCSISHGGIVVLTVDVQRNSCFEALTFRHRTIPHDATVFSAIVVALRCYWQGAGGWTVFGATAVDRCLQWDGTSFAVPTVFSFVRIAHKSRQSVNEKLEKIFR